MIYIAYNYESQPISIVNARNLDLANAFWQGRGIIPYSIKNLVKDFTSLSEHPTGVFPLFETEEISVGELSRDRDRKYLLVKKG